MSSVDQKVVGWFEHMETMDEQSGPESAGMV